MRTAQWYNRKNIRYLQMGIQKEKPLSRGLLHENAAAYFYSMEIPEKGSEKMESFLDIKGTDLYIHVPAELDHHQAEIIRKSSDQIIQNRNIRRIIFDFRKTNFMDSSGIGMIMGRYKNMRFMGGTVIAIHANERVRRILTLSGVYKVIDIYDGLPVQSNIL